MRLGKFNVNGYFIRSKDESLIDMQKGMAVATVLNTQEMQK